MKLEKRLSLLAAACEGMSAREWDFYKEIMERRFYDTQQEAKLSDAEELLKKLRDDFKVKPKVAKKSSKGLCDLSKINPS